MKKKPVITAVLALVCWTTDTCYATTLAEIVAEVSVNSYSNWHEGLFVHDGDSRGFTYPGSIREPLEQHDLARDFIASSFQAMGYTTWLDPFSFEMPGGITYINCNNVVAVKEGQGGSDIYIVGAHYDSVDARDAGVTYCPGADDNASGVAGMLEAARAIQDYIFRDTIIFIAFDGEEKFFKGSDHFVVHHTTDQVAETNETTFLLSAIKGMMSVDMIAYDDTNTPNRVLIGSLDSTTNSPIDLALAQAVTSYTTLSSRRGSNLGGSDHRPFHEAGVDAALLIESGFRDFDNNPPIFQNPNYHTDTDSVDTPGYISYGFAAEITKCIAGYLCEQAGAIPPATLYASLPEGNLFTINWETVPGVTYALLGKESLTGTNSWSELSLFESAPAPGTASVTVDVDGVSHQVFKVESR